MSRTGVVLLLVLALAMALAALPGCASVPECEQFDIGIAQTRQGQVFVLDETNLGKLFKRQRDLQDGKCRLPGGQGIGAGT